MKNYPIPVKKELFNKAMLMLMNFSLNLSEFEIDILATLLNNNFTTITEESKQVIRLTLNKDKFNTNNYIKRLNDKGMLIRGTDRLLHINPSIIEMVNYKQVSFEFQVNE